MSAHDDGSFSTQFYRVTYIAKPDGLNSFFSQGAPGKIFEIAGVNSKGVEVGITVGGTRTYVPAEGINERSFGVTWQIVLLRLMAYANTRDEAVEMLTKGTPEYRALTGRKTLLRTRNNNWLIADPNGACVVEATAYRYGMRYPGDFGEKNGGYIGVTNHNMITNSYDRDGNLTTVPMASFGGESSNPGSVTRFYTIQWLGSLYYGKMDMRMLQEFFSAHYYITKDGQRVDYVWNNTAGWIPAQLFRTLCSHGGYPEKYSGATDNDMTAVLGEGLVQFIVGRPCEWQGMRRTYELTQ